jgi:hypothetical protein
LTFADGLNKLSVMLKIINRTKSGTTIYYDRGGFDDWCVYRVEDNSQPYALKDIEYFSDLLSLAKKHGIKKVYGDFAMIYEATSSVLDEAVVEKIRDLSKSYGTDSEQIEVCFTALYATMVAEENKRNAVLKKRIKRLGVHQVLLEGVAPAEAAVFSKGKKACELDVIMKNKGF